MVVNTAVAITKGTVTYILTGEEETKLDNLMAKIVERREKSYKLYKYRNGSTQHENAQARTEETMERLSEYLRKILGVTDDAKWDEVLEDIDFSFIGDVQCPHTGRDVFEVAVEALVEVHDDDEVQENPTRH